MKHVVFLLFFIACTHHILTDAPSWVNGVRSGEEQLKVVHGNKIYYRRVAGSSAISKDTACEQVKAQAEEDIRKDYQTNLPYTVEVLYYDNSYQDCAITLSIANDGRAIASVPAPELELAQKLIERSSQAAKFALTGANVTDFEQHTNDKVMFISGSGICSKSLSADSFSIHGQTHVCWANAVVKGYCEAQTKQCWVNNP